MTLEPRGKSMKPGDFVKITCKFPRKVISIDFLPAGVNGNIGIITEVGSNYFDVWDTYNNIYPYEEDEIIPASDKEIRQALKEMIMNQGGKER